MHDVKNNDTLLIKKLGHTMKLFHHNNLLLFEKIALYPGQHELIFLLKDNKALTQKEIADKLHVKPSTINVTINRMEKAGFIQREKDKNDHRKTLITLTQEGQKIIDKVKSTVLESTKIILKDLTEEEKKQLETLLDKMSINMRNTFNQECPCRGTKCIQKEDYNA